MPLSRLIVLAALLGLAPAVAGAQDTYKIAPLKEAPPEGLAAEIKGALADQGFRISKGDGEPFVDLWLLKATSAQAEPGEPKGAVLFPFLEEGQLLGAARYHSEGFDYRDQSIVPGLYTVRYGLQPVNGDHLGVSPFRDFSLLVPAKQDEKAGPLEEKDLERQSAEAAGTNHPAVLMLVKAPGTSKDAPSMIRDEEKNLWGAVLPLPVKVGDAGKVTEVPVQLIVVGAAPL